MPTVIRKTDQEIFDAVVAHLRKQKKKAIFKSGVNSGRCAYRTDEGLKCAVGCLIPDEKYEKKLENKPVEHGLVTHLLRSLGYYNTDLLIALQEIHDDYGVEEWEQQFKILAKEHRVRYTEPSVCV